MRAITIHQPWAELIVRGEKDVENRSWRTHHRGPLLIHAGARADDASFAEHGVSDAADRGAIIGVVEVVDCTQERTSRWHQEGSWGWYLAGEGTAGAVRGAGSERRGPARKHAAQEKVALRAPVLTVGHRTLWPRLTAARYR